MNDESNTRQTNEPGIDAEEILDGILQWVCIESPSHDAAAVDRMADRVQHDMGSIGAHVERIPGIDGFGDIVKARTPWSGDGPGILVLSHIDTVHPIGSIDAMQTIAEEARQTPERLHTAPHNTPVGRLDEVRVARQLKLSEDH